MRFIFCVLLLVSRFALAEVDVQTQADAASPGPWKEQMEPAPDSAAPLPLGPAPQPSAELEALQQFLHPKGAQERKTGAEAAGRGKNKRTPLVSSDSSDFLAARSAYYARDIARLERYAQRLQKTQLEVYASYYQLSLKLKGLENKPIPDVAIKEVKSYLARPADTPMINELREEWLKLLGSKQQWALFDDEYSRMVNEDTELACYGLQSYRLRYEQAALREARKLLWFSGKGQPESCGTLFDAAITAGVISKQDIQQRLRLALEANNVSLAGNLAAQLAGKRTPLQAALKEAAADPMRYLRKLAQESSVPKKQTARATPHLEANVQLPVSAVSPIIPDRQLPFLTISGTNSLRDGAPAADTNLPLQTADWFDLGNLLSRLGIGNTDFSYVAGWKAANSTRKETGDAANAADSADCPISCVAASAETAQPAMLHPKLASEEQRTVALFALQRLAKQSANLAMVRWQPLTQYFTLAEQRYFYGRLAYEAARNQDGRALQWYQQASNTQLDERQAAWRVRAALRVQNWPEVLAGINAMSDSQQSEPAWRYWKARALQVQGKIAEAQEILVPLSKDFYFYGQLASAELADVPLLSTVVSTYKPDQQVIDEMQARPGIQRTLALYRMNLRNEALEEWRWAMRGLSDRELLTAAEIAKRNEMYDRAIGAAERTISVHDFGMRYLAPYRSELQAHIREFGLEEAWVYGLMRQESRFAVSAKSDVGASGLMQIMPSTARWVAKKLGLRSYRNALIHQLDTNLRLGTYYMKAVLAQSDNSPVLASAAYNAGPLRALQWRGEQPLEGAIYAETIPFEETRDYVKKVMSNTAYYAEQFGELPRSLKQRLGIIAARTAEAPAIP